MFDFLKLKKPKKALDSYEAIVSRFPVSNCNNKAVVALLPYQVEELKEKQEVITGAEMGSGCIVSSNSSLKFSRVPNKQTVECGVDCPRRRV